MMKHLLVPFVFAWIIATASRGFAEDYGTELQSGWDSMMATEYEEAAAHYRKSTELSPFSEDAWLGLQWALLSQEKWTRAKAAGKRMLELNDRNYYGLIRQAYIVYMLGDFSEAEGLYRRALEADSESGEAMLGLGFALKKQGEHEQGETYCLEAEKRLENDPRVGECLALTDLKDQVRFHVKALGSYQYYTDQWHLRDTKNLALTGDVAWPLGIGFWLGTGVTETVLRYEEDDFWMVNPVLGIFFQNNGWAVSGAASWLINNSDEVNNTLVSSLSLSYTGKIAGGLLEASGSFYPDFQVYQIDPRLTLRFLNDTLRISLGPELIVVASQTSGGSGGQGNGSGGSASATATTDLYWSGHLKIYWVPVERLSVYAAGYGGKRSYVVEESGLFVWPGDDVFIGGYRLGLGVTIWSHLSMTLTFLHDFGVEQLDMENQFSLIGGTLGVVVH